MWGSAAPFQAAGVTAIFACAWSDVVVDGHRNAPASIVKTGVSWSWNGAPWQLDIPDGPLRLEGAIGRASLHRVMARRAARLSRWRTETTTASMPEGTSAVRPVRGVEFASQEESESPAGTALVETLNRDTFVFFPDKPQLEGATRSSPTTASVRALAPENEAASLLRDAFVVTDGIETWSVSLISATAHSPALALFEGAVPPRDKRLWVLSSRLGTGRAPPRGGLGFGAGTPVETPEGPRLVETLRAGQTIITDAGPVPIRELRKRRAARAIVLPPGFFGDGGPDHPVRVGRDSWIGLEGPALHALFSLAEALVRAGDLETQPGVRLAGPGHLFTIGIGRTGLIMAGGLPFLCGQPLQSELRPLSCGETQITLAGPPGRVRPRMAFRGAA